VVSQTIARGEPSIEASLTEATFYEPGRSGRVPGVLGRCCTYMRQQSGVIAGKVHNSFQSHQCLVFFAPRRLDPYMRVLCQLTRFSLLPSPRCASIPLAAQRAFSTTPVPHKFIVKTKKQTVAMPADTTTKTGQPFDRAQLESLCKRRLFYTPSFEIYGGKDIGVCMPIRLA